MSDTAVPKGRRCPIAGALKGRRCPIVVATPGMVTDASGSTSKSADLADAHRHELRVKVRDVRYLRPSGPGPADLKRSEMSDTVPARSRQNVQRGWNALQHASRTARLPHRLDCVRGGERRATGVRKVRDVRYPSATAPASPSSKGQRCPICLQVWGTECLACWTNPSACTADLSVRACVPKQHGCALSSGLRHRRPGWRGERLRRSRLPSPRGS